MQLGAIPIDLIMNDRCIMADEIGDRHHNSMHPLKWKCTNECRLIEVVLGTKGLCQWQRQGYHVFVALA